MGSVQVGGRADRSPEGGFWKVVGGVEPQPGVWSLG